MNESLLLVWFVASLLRITVYYRTIALLVLFSQYLRNYKFPLPFYRFWKTSSSTTTTTAGDNNQRGWIVKRFDIFTLLPVVSHHLKS